MPRLILVILLGLSACAAGPVLSPAKLAEMRAAYDAEIASIEAQLRPLEAKLGQLHGGKRALELVEQGGLPTPGPAAAAPGVLPSE